MTTAKEATPDGRPSLVRRSWRMVAGNASVVLLWPRLQLAVKAGLAAGIAFAIAPLMPGAAAAYPYYAPLGALVVMYENVAGSMRQGVQTFAGLAIGIGLAFVLFLRGIPTPLTVGLVMALGVVLAGLPKLGAGRDWIPTAALLVLLVGGHDPDQFSFGYLLQMGAGIVVGILVNLLVFPPLHFRAAELSIAELRLALARQLSDMAKALKESWPPEHKEWSRKSDTLDVSARSVRLAVEKADASRRANPRRRLHPRDIERDYRNLRDLEQVTFHVQDVTQVLSDVIWAQDSPFVVPDQDAAPLADVMSAVSEVLRSLEEEDPDRQVELCEEASSAVKALNARVAADDAATDGPSAVDSILLSLNRMLRVVRSSAEKA